MVYDYKDYVCFRVTKFGRKNLREILEFVDKVEDKYELYLEFKIQFLCVTE